MAANIAKTAVHFVLKWGFEVSPVSNNARMLETEDFGDITSTYVCPWNGACKVMQGHPEKKEDFFFFFCDQSETYGIISS